jgi:hypothetical protein
MQLLSATEAISPAVTRTRNLLFRPFRWGTFLKLSLAALFTEGFSGGSNYSSPGNQRTAAIGRVPLHFNINPAMVAMVLVVIAVAMLIGIGIYYLVVRLRFALFHCVAYQIRKIGPGWRIYRAQAGRYFLLSIGVGFAFLVLLAGAAAPLVMGIVHFFQDHRGEQLTLGEFFSVFLPLIPLLLLAILVSIAVNVVLRDFMLPHIALENATAGQAWAAVWMRMGAEMGQFLLYTVLRVVIPFAVMMALLVALVIPTVVLVVIGVIVAGVVRAALGHAAMLLASVILIMILTVFFLFALICATGPVCLAIRSYALTFYGGRYQLLGNILFPPPPPAITTMEPGTA